MDKYPITLANNVHRRCLVVSTNAYYYWNDEKIGAYAVLVLPKRNSKEKPYVTMAEFDTLGHFNQHTPKTA